MDKHLCRGQDLTGQKFGRWTVLEKTHNGDRVLWKTICDCPNQTIGYVRAEGLKNGTSQSCGCYKKEKLREVNFKDLTGKRFGRYTVIKYVDTIKRKTRYLCLCDCGVEKIVEGNSLVRGSTVSCGCYHKDFLSSKAIDRIGQKFGRLTVIENLGKIDTTYYSNCQCECGNIIKIASGALVSGQTRSCGCLKKENDCKITDLTDNVYGRLTVLSYAGRDASDAVMWLCECECGNQKIVRGYLLKNGQTRSCGCLHKDSMSLKRGVNSHRWNPELTQEDRESRDFDDKETEWSRKIKERDDFTCQICKEKSGDLNSHHLYSYRAYPDLRYDLDNGICLCTDCHTKFHKLYGFGDNTAEQFNEFLGILLHFALQIQVLS